MQQIDRNVRNAANKLLGTSYDIADFPEFAGMAKHPDFERLLAQQVFFCTGCDTWRDSDEDCGNGLCNDCDYGFFDGDDEFEGDDE